MNSTHHSYSQDTMSNPMRMPSYPLTLKQAEVSILRDAYFHPTDEVRYKEMVEQARDLERCQRLLGGLDMELSEAFYVPKDLTVSVAILQSGRPVLATAQGGKPVFNLRTVLGKSVAVALFKEYTDGAIPGLSRDSIQARCSDRFYVSAGTEFAMGRLQKAYPVRGVSPSAPITESEARKSLRSCGLYMGDLPEHVFRKYPLLAREDEDGVRVNPKSDNGFPVLGHWEDEEAQVKIIALAKRMELDLTEAAKRPNGVWEKVREWEATQPWLVAFRGKCKADFYSTEKLESKRMRFYNALPRQAMLLMQTVTQPFEDLSRSIIMEGHSGIGVNLTHGGAADLVRVLEGQLVQKGRAFVHVGDDSWIVVRHRDKLVLFSLDCSNFDLTQHSATTLAVHRVLAEELRRFGQVGADLWYALVRERLVVTVATLVRRWKHGGPSGMPLQSKVNDMLMDVMIRRLLKRVVGEETVLTREHLDGQVQYVGRGMGFSVRLEDHYVLEAGTLTQALEQQPFLFIGMLFYSISGEVRVCADLARSLSQIPYKTSRWQREKLDLLVGEAMRLGSTVLSMGMPMPSLEAGYKAARQVAKELVERALRYGDVESKKLDWAVGQLPWGPEVPSSLKGLLRALEAPPEAIWQYKEKELPSTSSFHLFHGMSWADEAEAEQAAEVAAAVGHQVQVPPSSAKLAAIKALALTNRARRTHPVTSRNDGRPPPTAVWGPPKAPRPRREERAGPSGTRRNAWTPGMAFEAEYYASSEGSEYGGYHSD